MKKRGTVSDAEAEEYPLEAKINDGRAGETFEGQEEIMEIEEQQWMG